MRPLKLLLIGLAGTVSLHPLAGAAGKPARAKSDAAQAKPAEAATPASSRCSDDATGLSPGGGDSDQIKLSAADPRSQLLSLIQAAQDRSRPVGAARLLSEAARFDLSETRSSRWPQVNLNTVLGGTGSEVEGNRQPSGGQYRATLSASAPLYDFGRLDKLIAWRKEMAEAAKLNQASAEEQLALQTVSLAMDRSRFILQAQVYGQYVRKMTCLVEALETIIKVDKGRASELLQARKSYQQAELAYIGATDALRNTETRLKRLVGDALPPSASYSAVWTQVPRLDDSMSDILQAPDIGVASAQAKAQRHYADSVVAGQKPQISWMANASANAGVQRSKELFGGVSISIPIMQPGADASASAARQRAKAADLQQEEAIESKRYRLIEMHDSANASLDRAKRIVEVLRNSERVRASTLQQWQQLGRRSLFDVMSAESDYYMMRVSHVNAIYDAQQVIAMIWSMGRGVAAPLR